MTGSVQIVGPDAGGSGHVAELRLSNPPLNLITSGVLGDLASALTAIEQMPELRVLIVQQGDARGFSAGSDMKEFEGLRESASEQKILIENNVLRRLARLQCPTIAAIEGFALGGGLELALACDLRVAGRGARLALPEARVGGLASNGSQRLTKLVGPSRAKLMLFTGAELTGSEAESWGLVNLAVEDDTALESARGIAQQVAEMAPLSVRLAKRLVDVAADGPLDAGIAAGIEAQELIFRSDDLYEGSRAFREKRPPEFRGR